MYIYIYIILVYDNNIFFFIILYAKILNNYLHLFFDNGASIRSALYNLALLNPLIKLSKMINKMFFLSQKHIHGYDAVDFINPWQQL